MIIETPREALALTESEKNIAVDIANVLKMHIGKGKALTNKDIRFLFPVGLSERVIQKMINHIRNNDLAPCLIASSCGYYIAENEAELIEYEKSLANRINELVKVLDKISEQRAIKYSQPYQARLF